MVCKAQQTVCQVCLLDNIFLFKISYTPSLLQIPHLLIPPNTWCVRWNTQFIIFIRRRAISAHQHNKYNCLHNLPTSTSLTSYLNSLMMATLLLVHVAAIYNSYSKFVHSQNEILLFLCILEVQWGYCIIKM